MKRAFVLKLEEGIDIAQGCANGYIEDVETGREQVFCSVKQLLEFLQDVLNQQHEEEKRTR